MAPKSQGRMKLILKRSELLKAVFFLFTHNWISVLGTEWLSSLCSVIIFIEKWKTVAKASNHMMLWWLLFATSGNLPCKQSAFISAQVLSHCSACSASSLRTASHPCSLQPCHPCLTWHGTWADLWNCKGGVLFWFFFLWSSSWAKYYHMFQMLYLILDFLDFPQLLNLLFYSNLSKMEKCSYHPGFLSFVLLRRQF